MEILTRFIETAMKQLTPSERAAAACHNSGIMSGKRATPAVALSGRKDVPPVIGNSGRIRTDPATPVGLDMRSGPATTAA